MAEELVEQQLESGAENPPTSQNPKLSGHGKLVLILVVFGVALVLYLITSRSRGLFPFSEKIIVSPTPAPTTIPTSDETRNWKTYQNEEYGFEMKYPNDWIFEPLDDADEGAGIDGAETDLSIYRLRFASRSFWEDRFKNQENFTVEIVPDKSEFYRSSVREFADSLKVWSEYGIIF